MPLICPCIPSFSIRPDTLTGWHLAYFQECHSSVCAVRVALDMSTLVQSHPPSSRQCQKNYLRMDSPGTGQGLTDHCFTQGRVTWNRAQAFYFFPVVDEMELSQFKNQHRWKGSFWGGAQEGAPKLVSHLDQHCNQQR